MSQPALFVTEPGGAGIAQAGIAGRGRSVRGGGRSESGRVHRDGLRRVSWTLRRRWASCRSAAKPCRPPPTPRPAAWSASWVWSWRKVEQLCDRARGDGETLQVANHLCPGNVVISGDAAACERAAELAESCGAMKAVPLAVAGAFHTRLMEFGRRRSWPTRWTQVPLRRPRIPVVSNVDAQCHDDPEEIRAAAHTSGRVAGPLGRLHPLPARRESESTTFTRSVPDACCVACSSGSIAKLTCDSVTA